MKTINKQPAKAAPNKFNLGAKPPSKQEQSIVKAMPHDNQLATMKAANIEPSVAIEYGLTVIATEFSKPVAQIDVAKFAPAFDSLKEVAETAKDLESIAKKIQIAKLEAAGPSAVFNESGSRKIVVGGWQLQANKTGGTLDDKKVEAMLRAKDLDPGIGMDATVTFKSNEGKLKDLQENGTVSTEELEACKKEAGWAVQRPKRAE